MWVPAIHEGRVSVKDDLLPPSATRERFDGRPIYRTRAEYLEDRAVQNIIKEKVETAVREAVVAADRRQRALELAVQLGPPGADKAVESAEKFLSYIIDGKAK